MELKDLKKEYEKLSKKHKIPSFKELNECFEIDRTPSQRIEKPATRTQMDVRMPTDKQSDEIRVSV